MRYEVDYRDTHEPAQPWAKEVRDPKYHHEWQYPTLEQAINFIRSVGLDPHVPEVVTLVRLANLRVLKEVQISSLTFIIREIE